MKKTLIVSLLLIAAAGCKSPPTGKQMSGSDLVYDDKGHATYATYVTQEEYDRMTPEERQRMHAQMGAAVTIPLPGSKAASEPISEQDFKKSYSKEK